MSGRIIEMYAGNGRGFFGEHSSIASCSIGLNETISMEPHALQSEFCIRSYYGVACAAFAYPGYVPVLLERYKHFIENSNIVDSRRYSKFPDLRGKQGIIDRIEYIASSALAARVN